jgi:signal transduction histidine kinase
MDMPDGTLSITRLYEFLLRSTGDGILILDSGGRILHINPAGAAMLGVTTDDMIGKTPQECFRKNPHLLNLFYSTGETKMDVYLPRKRLAQGIASSLPTGERIVLLQDVTEKRDLENRREMLSKAIAHDLRNPIAAIGGFVDLVSRSGGLNESQKRFLLRAKQTNAKLHDMIVSLVDLAWIEAGMPLQHVPIRLDVAIERVVAQLQLLAYKQQVGIAVSLQKPLPLVMGDPERLNLVIYHLLHNALIYSWHEQNVVIHAWGDEDQLYCSVADQGIGISVEELPLIFDRGYRGRNEKVLALPGGGLGLTVARTIIRRHGGDIRVNSTAGVGSTFTFSLPVVEL